MKLVTYTLDEQRGQILMFLGIFLYLPTSIGSECDEILSFVAADLKSGFLGNFR